MTTTSIKLDKDLVDEATRPLGTKSRAAAVHLALREVIALKRFKALMRKYTGKLPFEGEGE